MNAEITIIKLIEAMNDQPIAFNKHYVFIGCGINGALMLSQLVYWSSRTKKKDGWIYKTHQEWTQETGLTRREQDTARKTLKSLGFLTEKKQGVPCKVYFKVEHEKLYQALMDYAQSLDTSQLHNSAKLDAPKRQTRCTDTPDCMHNSAKLDAQISPSITENTYREYTENTPESNKKKSTKPRKPKFTFEEACAVQLPSGVNRDLWIAYIEMRQASKKLPTQKAIEMILDDLNKWGHEKANQSIQNSIKSNWVGLFEPKQAIQTYATTYQSAASKNSQTMNDHDAFFAKYSIGTERQEQVIDVNPEHPYVITWEHEQ